MINNEDEGDENMIDLSKIVEQIEMAEMPDKVKVEKGRGGELWAGPDYSFWRKSIEEQMFDMPAEPIIEMPEMPNLVQEEPVFPNALSLDMPNAVEFMGNAISREQLNLPALPGLVSVEPELTSTQPILPETPQLSMPAMPSNVIIEPSQQEPLLQQLPGQGQEQMRLGGGKEEEKWKLWDYPMGYEPPLI